MHRTLSLSLATLIALNAVAQAQVVDNFSEGGWKRFSSTPGKMSAKMGKLHLQDEPGPPDWVTASRTFTVDIDETPIFAVDVLDVSGKGTVKLIRKAPEDKRVAIQIDGPGLYAVDMQKKFGWQGKAPIEACLYALGEEEEITFAYVKFAERLTPQEEEAVRRNRDPVGEERLDPAPFAVVPLFNTCSYYFRTRQRPDLSVTYCRKGSTWLKAYPPVYVHEDGMFRGSIVNLDEDTPYELRISDANGNVLAQEQFRTWCSQVPIGKTITLDEASFRGQLKIKTSGTPNGWVKVIARNGFVLCNDRSRPLIELYKARYVILEGLTLRGGLKEAIRIEKCLNVRVVNCDIAGWGRIGTQRFDLDGKYYTESGKAINWDSAILVSKSIGTVVERCYVHDPVSTANPWYYSHPAGPQAVGMDKSPSSVLRYNDFIGSDQHRWNDAVEGSGNFHIDGGFNRDGDVYGNFMCFANDDALEIDGGQTNVRVFLNKFEGCLCGVSIQGCMSGPSYVFQNLLVNMGDERDLAGQTIKTSSHANGPSAVSFIFGNTCYGPSRDLSLPHNLRIVAKNNIFAGAGAISGRKGSPQSDCDYNLLSTGKTGDEEHGILGKPEFVDANAGLFALRQTSPGIAQGVAIDNFAPDANGRPDMGAIPFGSDLILPRRPIPVELDRYQLLFSAAQVKSARAQNVAAAVRGEGFSSRFRIAKNDAFDWFRVTPETGILESGKPVTFTVTPDSEKMTKRTLYKGAFLIRLDNGCSRPVTVYAKTNVTPVAKPIRKGVWVTYAEAESVADDKAYETVADPSASGGKCIRLAGRSKREPIEYRFNVPKTGKYFVLLRVKSPASDSHCGTVHFGIDDGPQDRAKLRSTASWTWTMAAHNRQMSLICLQAFDLAAGEHVLTLAPRDSLDLDLIAITDNPGLFE